MNNKLECILLIDDDEATNYLHKMIIDKSDCTKECVVAENGLEALELLQAKKNPLKPDLIFLDINMPKMDGWEFLIEYKNIYKIPNSTILIMLSTSIHSNDKKKAESIEEINGFVNKPLSKETIQEVMRTYFPK